MKYPIGIQNFEKIRTEGFVYIDKTSYIYEMVTSGNYYFLSRPRRFGKSLLLSTIRAFYEGKQELFQGLKIYDAMAKAKRDWKAFPIMYLDFNTNDYSSDASLNEKLNTFLTRQEELYGRNETEISLGPRFEGVISRAYQKTGHRVVILVDEYDKPLLQAIGNEKLQDSVRNMLKGFYGALKSCDAHIEFAMLTGVTKFGKVSVFSDLNHLTDISMLPQYANICGITEEELHHCFMDGVKALAKANDMNEEECYLKLKQDFDGYHFYPNAAGVYNPFSLLSTLAFGVFRDYWFETGTPSFLVHQLKKTGYPLERMTEEELTADTLGSIDVIDENPLPLLYQSGYLTLKGYDREFKTYHLGFPNREVEQGFIKYLLPFYTPKVQDRSAFSIPNFVRDVRNGDAESFMRRLDDFFAKGDYQVMGDLELYLQNTLYVFFRLLGFYVDVERHTTNGRMDIIMQTQEYIYIIELKIDQSADIALQQIKDKGYDHPFADDTRKLFRIGINFSTKKKLIDDWRIE